MIATKNEKIGFVNNDQRPQKRKPITSVIDKRDKNLEGDGEAGVNTQVEQLNHMPELDTFPMEHVKTKNR